MNNRTGELMTEAKMRENFTSQEQQKFFTQFDADDMTAKQKETLIVSGFDTRSKLGILRRKAIKSIGRNSPCPCGSEIKFKKCCLR